MGSAKLQAAIVAALLAGSFGLGQLVARNHLAPSVPETSVETREIAAVPAELDAVDLEGRPARVPLRDRRGPLLALVLSVDCPFCERNMPSWIRLVDELEAGTGPGELVALSVSEAPSTRAYLHRHGLEIPVRLIGPEAFRSLGLDGVPSTLVLRPDGEGGRIWSGVLSDDVRGEIVDHWRGSRLASANGGPAALPDPDCCRGPVVGDGAGAEDEEAVGPAAP